MDDVRIGHSRVGVAAFVMSVLSVVLLIIFLPLISIYLHTTPASADHTGVAFGGVMLVLVTAIFGVVALVLGAAGAIQQRRKRMFAFLGLAFSFMALGLIYVTVTALANIVPALSASW